MSRAVLIPINGEALRAAIQKRGLSLTAAARDSGFTDNYYTKAITRGSIARPATVMLQSLYNIKPEEYVTPSRADTEPETEQDEPAPPSFV